LTASLPPRGSVIRYGYLWAREHARGIAEGQKDRPSLVLALSIIEADKRARVYAAAITHSPPRESAGAVEMPLTVKRMLGLDAEPAWIVTTEVNSFVWPGPDIRPIPGRPPGTLIYGRIPDELLEKTIRSFLENRKRLRTKIVTRSP
jgi:hypothetical protein